MPAAVAAAAQYRGPAAPFATCGTASGGEAPARQPVALPCHHCALCPGFAVGLLPDGPGRIGVHPATVTADVTAARRTLRLRQPDYAAAQPRAPPLPV